MQTATSRSPRVIEPRRQTLRNQYAILGLFCGALIFALLLLDALAPSGRHVARIAGVDPPVYYGIAHSLLFDRDVNLTNEFQHFEPSDRMWTLVQKNTGYPGSVYGIGYSLVGMPFLVAGYVADALSGHAAGGYGRFAVLGFCLTNVFLAGFGLMALFRLLAGAGTAYGLEKRRAGWISLFVVFATFFGTNVGYYTFSPMSHAATFFWASLFLACWWEIRSDTAVRHWILLGLMGGMLSITRWQEIWYLGGPPLLDAFEGRFRGDLRPWLRSRAAYAAAAAFCWIPQLLEWRSIFGHYLTVPQGADFFQFPPVHIVQALFSSRSGWFFWTPLTLIGVCGLVYGASKISRFYWPLLAIVGLEWFVVGSLRTSWSGHDSFSARYLTSSVPLAAFGFAAILFAAPALWRRTVVICALVSIVFTTLFAVQYRLDLIPRDERLTAAEAFSDKLHLMKVRRWKAEVLAATVEMNRGDIQGAVRTLRSVDAESGNDRDVLTALAAAYRRAGQPAQAADAERRLQSLVRTELM